MATCLFLDGLAHRLDTGALDKVRQVERRLLEAALSLQVLALGAPMSRHGHCVSRGLEVDEQLGILGRHVVHLDHVGPVDQLLERGHAHAGLDLELALGDLGLVVVLVLLLIVLLVQVEDPRPHLVHGGDFGLLFILLGVGVLFGLVGGLGLGKLEREQNLLKF